MENLISIKDFEQEASLNLEKGTYDYYRSGANAQITLKDNIEEYKKLKLK